MSHAEVIECYSQTTKELKKERLLEQKISQVNLGNILLLIFIEKQHLSQIFNLLLLVQRIPMKNLHKN